MMSHSNLKISGWAYFSSYILFDSYLSISYIYVCVCVWNRSNMNQAMCEYLWFWDLDGWGFDEKSQEQFCDFCKVEKAFGWTRKAFWWN